MAPIRLNRTRSHNQLNCNQLTLHNFFGNYLEPLAYLLYLMAVVLFAKTQSSRRIRLLQSYYVLAFLLMLTASHKVPIGA